MKHLLLLLLCSGAIWATAQPPTPKLIQTPDSLCDEAMRVYLVFRGDSVVTNCDSLYLVNSVAANNYLKYLRFVKATQRGAEFQALINLYDRRLAEQDTEYEQLRRSLETMMTTSAETMQRIESNADSVSQSLLLVNQSLTLANDNLALVKQTIKQERWNSVGKKILWGVGGLGLGILIGVLVGQGR
jgi:hypothetical protein